MERLTYTEGGVVLTRGVDRNFCTDVCKKQEGCDECPIYLAMVRLAAYEDICPDPERLKEVDQLYLEKCREVNELRERLAYTEQEVRD